MKQTVASVVREVAARLPGLVHVSELKREVYRLAPGAREMTVFVAIHNAARLSGILHSPRPFCYEPCALTATLRKKSGGVHGNARWLQVENPGALRRSMILANGNASRAARMTGVHRKTVKRHAGQIAGRPDLGPNGVRLDITPELCAHTIAAHGWRPACKILKVSVATLHRRMKEWRRSQHQHAE